MYTSTEKPLPFATVSPNKEHGPAAIWAHLKPVLEYLKIEHPDRVCGSRSTTRGSNRSEYFRGNIHYCGAIRWFEEKTKLKFAGLVTRKCNREDDGDYIVTFLVKQGTDDCYLLNEKDVSAIDFAQVNAVLPQPEIVMRGSERFAYKFPCCLENYF
ncbi:uncharacterized protein LOC120354068 [Nilaparvata lugens]|uniref:uncharacterized protein LOC120354068 n=1 Tax=Nilaparvata lugens TaxID=108931 RepID=UPI00193D5F8B|nr:uncharacterized protein LOC120354068 [Nilaparvata lugens]